MITAALARALRDAGLRWHPAPGDRFAIDGDEFADEVFTISEMTIEAHDYSGTTVLGFNGTTEWALDSVAADDSLWLPREDQLRILLGPSFRSLTHQGTDFTVETQLDSYSATDAESAYALALLDYIKSSLEISPDEPTP
ncbi:pilus assembly protein CpaE [Frondihabitans sp. VKM Ac-2883]|uniref:pilus assembly protein CpaE n=1 Tax=Frondihabitans sp. VKM Ac-2883 TaxID=2783823 RepID=UPI00188ABDB7|nr:pilus assembly protein CpaE [Frondihabitans sp. VKM Ac-2883]MBF4577083.1 pilus assembly protein CpaE [Frondihabitans sp. VKM Ac-2883]